MDVNSQHILVDSLRKTKGTSTYQTTGKVTRIEDSDIYVRFSGAETDTCIESSSVAVSAGDTVDIFVSNYDTHITGNRTARATDDTQANHATGVADAARRTSEYAKREAETANSAAAAASVAAAIADAEAKSAASAAEIALGSATMAQDAASAAQADASAAHSAASAAEDKAAAANTAAHSASMSAVRAQAALDSIGDWDWDAEDFDPKGSYFYKDSLGAHIMSGGESDRNVLIDSGGMHIFTSGMTDGVNEIAHIGYGMTVNEEGQVNAPYFSFGEREQDSVIGERSFVSGNGNVASGASSHAEGGYTVASFTCSHAEGNFTTSSGRATHAEGRKTTASGFETHAEGSETSASNLASHAEGELSAASNRAAHAEGYNSAASGQFSHAEGGFTKAQERSSHAEGESTIASGQYSHAEGSWSQATNEASHAEGYLTVAGGSGSHAEGRYTAANGEASHAGGLGTKAEYDYQTAVGKHNDNKEENAFEIGNGTNQNKSNAFEVDWDGNVTIAGNETLGGDLSAAGNATFGGNATIDGNVNLGGNLAVTKGGVTIPAVKAVEGDNYGHGLLIGAGGLTLIGSGESAQSVWDAGLFSAGGEAMAVASDNMIYFLTNCNTIGNRAQATMSNNQFIFDGNNGVFSNPYALFSCSVEKTLSTSDAKITCGTQAYRVGTGIFSANAGGIKVSKAGNYLVTVQIATNSGYNSGDQLNLRIYRDSTSMQRLFFRGSGNTGCCMTRMCWADAGATFYLYASNGTSARGVIAANGNTFIQVVAV